MLKHLGRGTFGQVLKVQSSGNRVYAVKVIRNRPAFLKQAEIEVELLQRLRIPRTAKGVHSDAAKDPRALVVQMYDHFVYKNHLCLVFEELGVNLLQLLQQRPVHPARCRLWLEAGEGGAHRLRQRPRHVEIDGEGRAGHRWGRLPIQFGLG